MLKKAATLILAAGVLALMLMPHTAFGESPIPETDPSLIGWIAYSKFNTGYVVPGYDLYVASADGKSGKFLSMGARQPHFHGGGVLVANDEEGVFSRDGLIVVHLDGTEQPIESFAEDAYPRWAWDGRRVLLVHDKDATWQKVWCRAPARGVNIVGPIFVIEDIRGEDKRRQVHYQATPLFGKSPVWVSDYMFIYAGCSDWRGDGHCGLYLADVRGAMEPIRLTEGLSDIATDVYMDWMTFMSRRDDNWEIYIMKIDGTRMMRMTNHIANDGLPTWSPDGKMIAFVSDRSGEWAVWVMRADGSGLRQLFELGEENYADEKRFPDHGWLTERIDWWGPVAATEPPPVSETAPGSSEPLAPATPVRPAVQSSGDNPYGPASTQPASDQHLPVTGAGEIDLVLWGARAVFGALLVGGGLRRYLRP